MLPWQAGYPQPKNDESRLVAKAARRWPQRRLRRGFSAAVSGPVMPRPTPRSLGLRVADLFDLIEDEVACLAIWRVRPCRCRAWVQVATTVTGRRRAAQRRRVVSGCPNWSPSYRTSDLRGSHREAHRTPSARGLEPPRSLTPASLRYRLWAALRMLARRNELLI